MNNIANNLSLINMEDVIAKGVDWLWYPYIPLGKLTIVQGDPGEGKTTFVLHLTALLTRGEPLPEDDREYSPINVIYQTAEDGLEDTIKPRLVKAGANCSKVLVIDESANPLTMLDERIEAAIIKTRVIAHEKSSLAPEGNSIAFQLNKETGFHWLGHYDISVDDLLMGGPRENKIDRAETFLEEILLETSLPQQEVLEKAAPLGISKRVLYQAKKNLNIKSKRVGNIWHWEF